MIYSGGATYCYTIQSIGSTLLIGGLFNSVGGITAYGVVKYNTINSTFSAFPTLIIGGQITTIGLRNGGICYALSTINNTIFICGSFDYAGGISSSRNICSYIFYKNDLDYVGGVTFDNIDNYNNNFVEIKNTNVSGTNYNVILGKNKTFVV